MNSDMTKHYDVFLSYSHEDARIYGKDYIQRIKDAIESELYDVTNRSLVFLDTDALGAGDEWHAKITEKLNECRVFVCLVSENYLNKAYCKRERLLWARKEIQNGMARKATCPVYYIELRKNPNDDDQTPEVKDLFGFQLGNEKIGLEPWFRNGVEHLKKEFVAERLEHLKAFVRGRIQTIEALKNSFSSVIPSLNKNFVGRIDELKRLGEECANKSIPVITAYGGFGKTELAIAYADGYADEYPEGRFLIPMENVHKWIDALKKMIGRRGMVAGKRQPVHHYLGITDEELHLDDEELHEIIVDKLFERAEKGRLLLLLDNVDDVSLLSSSKLDDLFLEMDIPDNIQIIATTRQSISFGKYDKAKEFPIGNLDEQASFELFCIIGGEQFPFSKCVPNEKDPEYKACMKIVKLLEGHAWSMEVVAGFMNNNYKTCSFLRKFEELQGNCNISGESRRNSAVDADSLLKPSIEAIRKLELGDKIIEIATVASMFVPENIPEEILHGYWNEYYKSVNCSKGDALLYALQELECFHLLARNGDDFKMHRLTISVLKKNASDLLGLAERCGRILSRWDRITTEYWLSLINATPEFIDYAPVGLFSNDDWETLLEKHEKLAKYCPFDLLKGYNWSRLLIKKPSLAQYCAWDKLSGDDIARILSVHPEFAENCNLEVLNGWDWLYLLRRKPEFAISCHWDRLHECPGVWGELLSAHPQFESHCHFDKLTGDDIVDLVTANPAYLEKCPLKAVSLDNWADIVSIRPDLLEQNELYKEFSGDNWETVLSKQPDLIDKCPKEVLTGQNWWFILSSQPSLENDCPWVKLEVSDWSGLLAEKPEFAKHCTCWDEFSGDDWCCLLDNQPQFEQQCNQFNGWWKLDGGCWSSLLVDQPSLKDKCVWETLTGEDWGALLESKPEFEQKCPWGVLKGSDISRILFAQPQLLSKCDLTKLSGEDWAYLLLEQPQLSEYCDWNLLSGEDWASLLSGQAIFSEHCQWDKLNGDDWESLISCKPNFADKCDLEKLSPANWVNLLGFHAISPEQCPWQDFDGDNWETLLSTDDSDKYVTKCDWQKLTGKNWSNLLDCKPQFAEFCNWSKLTADDFANLLDERPSFESMCPENVWKCMSGSNWARILESSPQFADRCDWSKLSGKNWAKLLTSQPQFCNVCVWEKLDEKDWEKVLQQYPHFKKYRSCSLNSL